MLLLLALPAMTAAQIVDQNKAVDPTATVPEPSPTSTPTPEPGPEPSPNPTPTPTPEPGPQPSPTPTGEAIRRDPGYGSAALQPEPAKRAEARADCVQSRPPVSPMLALGGSVAGDEGTSWSWLIATVVVGAAALAITMYLTRRRRAGGKPTEPRGALETVSTLVAIVGGAAGVAVLFIPGLQVDEKPPAEANMSVREVHPRITRGEYATRMRAKVRLSKEDRREVGTVVWLKVQLSGYARKRPVLQYALYDRDPAVDGVLLPRTVKQVRLLVEDEDVQTSFVPIWVGYPKSMHFEGQFRLLDRQGVRAVATTGKMRGSSYRYTCTPTS